MSDSNADPSLSPNSPSPQSSLKPGIYIIIIVMLVVGIALGYLFSVYFPGKSIVPVSTQKSTTDVVFPTDVVQIQACANNKGTLYIKPADIPVGPVYMVHEGRVIGIEFMLARDEFLSEKSFKYLVGAGLKVDHVNIGLLSQGHEGYTVPHYHVDLYTVTKEVESTIKCPGVSPNVVTSPIQIPASPSAY